jgi:hypothetical protein
MESFGGVSFVKDDVSSPEAPTMCAGKEATLVIDVERGEDLPVHGRSLPNDAASFSQPACPVLP